MRLCLSVLSNSVFWSGWFGIGSGNGRWLSSNWRPLIKPHTYDSQISKSNWPQQVADINHAMHVSKVIYGSKLFNKIWKQHTNVHSSTCSTTTKKRVKKPVTHFGHWINSSLARTTMFVLCFSVANQFLFSSANMHTILAWKQNQKKTVLHLQIHLLRIAPHWIYWLFIFEHYSWNLFCTQKV